MFSRSERLIVPDYAAADGTLKVILPVALSWDLMLVFTRCGRGRVGSRVRRALHDGVQALYVARISSILTRRAEIAARVARHTAASDLFFREFAQSGGLMSYGYGFGLNYIVAPRATWTRSLKGASPGELPLQSAEKYRASCQPQDGEGAGPHNPQLFLLRADEVVE